MTMTMTAAWFPIALLLLGSDLDDGRSALTDFRYEEAAATLERARDAGPYAWRDHVSLYENLGVAYASLGKIGEARRAFEMLLALDPGHAIPYTLAPKITFIFEEARRNLNRRPSTELQMNWPQGVEVDQTIPVSVAVIADPAELLKRATLFARRRGEQLFAAHELELLPSGEFLTIALPPPAIAPSGAGTLELYLVARDQRDNEVFELGGPDAPRTIALGYEEEVPWYGRWWIWASVAAVVAAGVSVGVYFAVQPPPESVPVEPRIDNWP